MIPPERLTLLLQEKPASGFSETQTFSEEMTFSGVHHRTPTP
jgi:hypothetical protein